MTIRSCDIFPESRVVTISAYSLLLAFEAFGPRTVKHESHQVGFRWLYASGTTIGCYQNGNGTLAALRPVYPGGSSVLRVSAITRYRWHEANGRFETIGDFVAVNCCLRPGKPDGR